MAKDAGQRSREARREERVKVPQNEHRDRQSRVDRRKRGKVDETRVN